MEVLCFIFLIIIENIVISCITKFTYKVEITQEKKYYLNFLNKKWFLFFY